ncbi:hypothetical protein [Phytopseudomonas dryadis]|uniref:Uncharacterized protein n=1 Tax=Phytopseudomonas dryadis TaxID=2487520 RepID=A0A4Q9QYX3_9GAMM|nr:hypothetical protein [Pseudomonas dryadis]TBU90596.1 hypothetical protein DNK44_15300 [Pseudomonas dryadis]
MDDYQEELLESRAFEQDIAEQAETRPSSEGWQQTAFIVHPVLGLRARLGAAPSRRLVAIPRKLLNERNRIAPGRGSYNGNRLCTPTIGRYLKSVFQ